MSKAFLIIVIKYLKCVNNVLELSHNEITPIHFPSPAGFGKVSKFTISQFEFGNSIFETNLIETTFPGKRDLSFANTYKF